MCVCVIILGPIVDSLVNNWSIGVGGEPSHKHET